MLTGRERIFEQLHTLGCTRTAVGGAPAKFSSADGWKRAAAELSETALAYREAGFQFGYHNHSFEFMRFGERSGFEILTDESDPALLVEMDTYWVAHGGADPAHWLRRLAGRVPYIHVKDFTISPERKQTFTEVGEGNLNWPEILDAARGAGVEWYIVEQDTCPGDPIDSLALSLKNMRAWGLS